MTIVGTKNAHNLITISSDGKLCVWAVENLIQPIVNNKNTIFYLMFYNRKYWNFIINKLKHFLQICL